MLQTQTLTEKTLGLLMMEGSFKWKLIEKRIKEMIRYPNKKFSNFPVAKDNLK